VPYSCYNLSPSTHPAPLLLPPVILLPAQKSCPKQGIGYVRNLYTHTMIANRVNFISTALNPLMHKVLLGETEILSNHCMVASHAVPHICCSYLNDMLCKENILLALDCMKMQAFPLHICNYYLHSAIVCTSTDCLSFV